MSLPLPPHLDCNHCHLTTPFDPSTTTSLSHHLMSTTTQLSTSLPTSLLPHHCQPMLTIMTPVPCHRQRYLQEATVEEWKGVKAEGGDMSRGGRPGEWRWASSLFPRVPVDDGGEWKAGRKWWWGGGGGVHACLLIPPPLTSAALSMGPVCVIYTALPHSLLFPPVNWGIPAMTTGQCVGYRLPHSHPFISQWLGEALTVGAAYNLHAAPLFNCIYPLLLGDFFSCVVNNNGGSM